MKKSRATRPSKKLRRNPMAHALAGPKFRARVARTFGDYRRRPKRVRLPEPEE